MIRTFYFAGLNRHKPHDFTAVSIARVTPVWFKGPALPFLTPPLELVQAIKAKRISQKQYEEIFTKNVLDRLPDKNALAGVFAGMGENLLLCCYEKPGDFCHRHLLASRLSEMGIECKEFDPSPSLSLFGGVK